MVKDTDVLAEVRKKTRDIVSLVNEGYMQSTDAYVLLKQIEVNAKSMKDELKEQTIDLIHQIGFNNRTIDTSSASIELRSSAGRWDFSHIKEITDLEEELKRLKERSKLAYKNEQSGSYLVTEDAGEIVTSAKFIPGSETIAVKLKK